MRRVVAVGIVLASVFAFAADLPVRAAQLNSAAPVNSWSGFYLGGHLGGAWSRENWTLAQPSFQFGVLTHFGGELDNGGSFIGGGQIGYNFQVQSWVFGAEFNASWMDSKSKLNVCAASIFIPILDCQSEMNWLASATAKVGWSFQNKLLYAKGGAAWTRASYKVSSHTAPPVDVLKADENLTGWTLGAGLEYSFAPHWSMFAEYDYYDFGTQSVTFAPTPAAGFPEYFDIHHKIDVVKIGLNYHFGG